jgi:radical SAM superfamily enzyme YgiQ (UPF0313 family)
VQINNAPPAKRHAKKILLLHPPIGKGIRDGINYPHIGLASIAAYLMERGHEARVIDLTFLKPERVPTALKGWIPDFVGITAYTRYVQDAHKAAEQLKTIYRGVRVVVGGCHVTAMPRETLQQYSGFDFGISGEGEDACHKLMESESDSDLYEIPGLCFREAGGNIRVNPCAKYLNMDTLPIPAWELYDVNKYRAFATYFTGVRLTAAEEYRVETHRGCPFSCSFCSHSLGNSLRLKDVKKVLAELSFHHNTRGIKYFLLNADTFTANRDYARQICQALIDSPLAGKIHWGCATRVDCLDEALVDIMARAGCFWVMVGIEVGDPEVQQAIHKNIDLAHAKKIIAASQARGISMNSNFVLGLPQDGIISTLRTILYSVTCGLDTVSYSVYTPFPGSELHGEIQKGKWPFSIKSRDWSRYDTQNSFSVGRHHRIPAVLLRTLHLFAYFLFYCRPRYWRTFLYRSGLL